jgi:hypothetical protein
MTDRVHSLTVCLEKDISIDDLEATKSAILQLKNVIAVEVNIADSTSWMAETRARTEIANKIFNVIYGDKK